MAIAAFRREPGTLSRLADGSGTCRACDGGLEVGVVLGIEPGDAAAPAEAGDGETAGVALVRLRPSRRRIEIRHDLLVGDLGDDLLEDILNVGHRRDVALTGVERRRDRK